VLKSVPIFRSPQGPAYPTLGSLSSHGHPGSSTQIDGNLQGSKSLTERNDACTWIWNARAGRYQCTFFTQNPATTTDWRNVGRMGICILPDDVLLEIFDFFVVGSDWFEMRAENWCWWRTLVHVCQKWRNVIFGSPHRLNLRLLCSDRTPVREMLDVWPPLPIVIHHYARIKIGHWGGDNIIAARKRNDRVCQINVELDPHWELEKLSGAMQEPFPALISLVLSSDVATVFPDSFMGGSVPHLQDLRLLHVPIPGLPKLLLSATGLVRLILRRIPHSGYISPGAIVACLSTLPRLEELDLGFESRRSRPNGESRRLPHPHALFSPPSLSCTFMESANIWRTSWPRSIVLYSTVWR
jgi:hypothetical protein